MISAVSVPVIFVLLGFKPAFSVLLVAYMLFGSAFAFQDSLASALMVDLNRKSPGYMNTSRGIRTGRINRANIFYKSYERGT